MRLAPVLAVVALVLTGAADAQPVYRCVHADGSVYLGQERPAPGSCTEQSTTHWDPPAPAAPAAPAPPAPILPAPAASPDAPRGRTDVLASPPAGEPSGRYGLWERREGGAWRDVAAFTSPEPCRTERDRRAETAKSRGGDVRYWCLPEGIRPS
jgi:hypothetical protein